MVVKTPEKPANGLSPKEITGPVSGTSAPPAPTLPSGYVRLADVRKKAASKPSYETLAPFIGKTIVLESIEVKMSDDGKKLASGTMTFSEFAPDRPEGADYPILKSAIPKGALRTIADAAKTRPDDTIVCDVVQTKRGLALR